VGASLGAAATGQAATEPQQTLATSAPVEAIDLAIRGRTSSVVVSRNFRTRHRHVPGQRFAHQPSRDALHRPNKKTASAVQRP
jgi:hypothetical protein